LLKFRNVANSTRPPATRAKGKLKKIVNFSPER
jgi:hypothetical protein